LTEEQRWGIIISWKYYNESYEKICNLYDIASKGTITKIIDKYKQQGNICFNYHFSGNLDQSSSEKEDIKDHMSEIIKNDLS